MGTGILTFADPGVSLVSAFGEDWLPRLPATTSRSNPEKLSRANGSSLTRYRALSPEVGQPGPRPFLPLGHLPRYVSNVAGC